MTETASRLLSSADKRDSDLAHLKALERQVLWLACWTIHHANH